MPSLRHEGKQDTSNEVRLSCSHKSFPQQERIMKVYLHTSSRKVLCHIYRAYAKIVFGCWIAPFISNMNTNWGCVYYYNGSHICQTPSPLGEETGTQYLCLSCFGFVFCLEPLVRKSLVLHCWHKAVNWITDSRGWHFKLFWCDLLYYYCFETDVIVLIFSCELNISGCFERKQPEWVLILTNLTSLLDYYDLVWQLYCFTLQFNFL